MRNRNVRTGKRTAGHYLVRPHDVGAPTFYVRGHTPREAADKARARLAAMREGFTGAFDLVRTERTA